MTIDGIWSAHLEYIELREKCESQMQIEVCNGCDSCWLRCSDGVQADAAEWDALQSYQCNLDSSEAEALTQVLNQDKEVDMGDGVSVTMCRFFDMNSRKCSVYPARPLVCRLLGHVEWMPCPIEKIESVINTPDALALLGVYSKRQRRTFDEWEAIKR